MVLPSLFPPWIGKGQRGQSGRSPVKTDTGEWGGAEAGMTSEKAFGLLHQASGGFELAFDQGLMIYGLVDYIVQADVHEA